jgi:hypothetical protein
MLSNPHAADETGRAINMQGLCMVTGKAEGRQKSLDQIHRSKEDEFDPRRFEVGHNRLLLQAPTTKSVQ